jgi:hypothetical protein
LVANKEVGLEVNAEENILSQLVNRIQGKITSREILSYFNMGFSILHTHLHPREHRLFKK